MNIPDIKPLFSLGWDMHLFRLVGTFMDPAFLSIIIVLGSVIAINYYLTFHKKHYLLIILFLLISLAFTYSRAGYFAYLAVLTVIGIHKKVYSRLLFIAFRIIYCFIPDLLFLHYA